MTSRALSIRGTTACGNGRPHTEDAPTPFAPQDDAIPCSSYYPRCGDGDGGEHRDGRGATRVGTRVRNKGSRASFKLRHAGQRFVSTIRENMRNVSDTARSYKAVTDQHAHNTCSRGKGKERFSSGARTTSDENDQQGLRDIGKRGWCERLGGVCWKGGSGLNGQKGSGRDAEDEAGVDDGDTLSPSRDDDANDYAAAVSARPNACPPTRRPQDKDPRSPCADECELRDDHPGDEGGEDRWGKRDRERTDQPPTSSVRHDNRTFGQNIRRSRHVRSLCQTRFNTSFATVFTICNASQGHMSHLTPVHSYLEQFMCVPTCPTRAVLPRAGRRRYKNKSAGVCRQERRHPAQGGCCRQERGTPHRQVCSDGAPASGGPLEAGNSPGPDASGAPRTKPASGYAATEPAHSGGGCDARPDDASRSQHTLQRRGGEAHARIPEGAALGTDMCCNAFNALESSCDTGDLHDSICIYVGLNPRHGTSSLEHPRSITPALHMIDTRTSQARSSGFPAVRTRGNNRAFSGPRNAGGLRGGTRTSVYPRTREQRDRMVPYLSILDNGTVQPHSSAYVGDMCKRDLRDEWHPVNDTNGINSATKGGMETSSGVITVTPMATDHDTLEEDETPCWEGAAAIPVAVTIATLMGAVVATWRDWLKSQCASHDAAEQAASNQPVRDKGSRLLGGVGGRGPQKDAGKSDRDRRPVAWEARLVGGQRLSGPRPRRCKARDRRHRRRLIAVRAPLGDLGAGVAGEAMHSGGADSSVSADPSVHAGSTDKRRGATRGHYQRRAVLLAMLLISHGLTGSSPDGDGSSASGEVQLYEQSEPLTTTGLHCLDTTSVGAWRASGSRSCRSGAVGVAAVGQMHPRADPSTWTGLARWEPPAVGSPQRAAEAPRRSVAYDVDAWREEYLHEASNAASYDRDLNDAGIGLYDEGWKQPPDEQDQRPAEDAGPTTTCDGDLCGLAESDSTCGVGRGKARAHARADARKAVDAYGMDYAYAVMGREAPTDDSAVRYASAEVQLNEQSDPSPSTGLLCLDAASFGTWRAIACGGRRSGALSGAAVGQLHPRADPSPRTGLARWETPTVGLLQRAAVAQQTIAADNGSDMYARHRGGLKWTNGFRHPRARSTSDCARLAWDFADQPDQRRHDAPDGIHDDGHADLRLRCCLSPTAVTDSATLDDCRRDARDIIDQLTEDRPAVRGIAAQTALAERTGNSARPIVGWWTEATRIGEALNPGPVAVPNVAYRHPLRADESVISYPAPGKGCLFNVIAPGHARPRVSCDGEEAFRLVVETVNPTGWTALKRRLSSTDAHVLLAQETWVNQSAMAGASNWARRHGWRSIWSPAFTTAKGGTSAGVAIFARDFLGLHFPEADAHEIVPARAVMGVLEAPGRRPMRVFSCYL